MDTEQLDIYFQSLGFESYLDFVKFMKDISSFGEDIRSFNGLMEASEKKEFCPYVIKTGLIFSKKVKNLSKLKESLIG